MARVAYQVLFSRFFEPAGQECDIYSVSQQVMLGLAVCVGPGDSQLSTQLTAVLWS